MSMLSFEEASTRLLAAARPVADRETVSLEAALGRVLAADCVSPINVPGHDNSAMDGYAIRTEDVLAEGVRLPVSQRIPAGSIGHALSAGTAARIFTGAPVPPGADAVVMQELCVHEHEQVVVNHVPVAGENIRRAGEDIARGATVLAAGQKLNAQCLGLLASVGQAQVSVYRRLRVALFSTGDELVTPGEALPPGRIYNSNRDLLKGLLRQMGCEVTDLGIVADTLADTRSALRGAAADHDLIITSGGVSVGEEDHVKPAVEAEGRLTLWAIAIKPGKPLAFGEIYPVSSAHPAGSGAHFIGLPGNPVAAFVTFAVLVAPFIRRLQGMGASFAPATGDLPGLSLPADFHLKKADRRRNFLRGRVQSDGRIGLFANQGSGVLTSTVWAEGLVDVPADTTLNAGAPVRFLSFATLLG